MATPSPSPDDLVARARAWRHALQAAVCDVLDPWAHGTIVRSTRYPNYFDYNVVRVERDPAMSVDELVSFADGALAGLPHRRVDYELVSAAEPLRSGLEARGWKAMRLLWMRHEAALGAGPDVLVEEVSYEAVHDLRVSWHREDFPDQDADGYHVQAREVALRRGVQVLAVREGGTPVAFAQLERDRTTAEITQVYVHPEYRSGGRGTAITRAAIEAAGEVHDLWICADDEDRPKDLYARLGFRPVWKVMEFTRWP